MTDIVELLRNYEHGNWPPVLQAADEIERLRHDNDYLRRTILAEQHQDVAAMRERCAVEATKHICQANCLVKGCEMAIAAAIRALPLTEDK